MRKWHVAAGAAILVAITVYFAFFRPSDEDRIRSQLSRLAEAVEVTEGGSNPILRKARLDDAFGKVFDEDVRVSIPELSTLKSGRGGLVALAMQASVWARSAHLEFSHIEIKLDDARASAKVGAKADVRVVDGHGSTRRDDRAVDFRFAKADGDWKITSVTVWRKDEARPE
jgi:hypothetical protein